MTRELDRGDRAYVVAFWASLAGAVVFGLFLFLHGCTVAGEPCGASRPCARGQVCGAGRCQPERAVPAPGGPL